MCAIEIETFWKDEHLKRGYQLVYTPHIASEEIYKISGHLEAYADMMYAPMDIDGQPYRVKPMNCPGHIYIFQSHLRSYRDLPIRYAELGTVYRYERSGVLHGLLRVRGFTQDDSHIFCRPDQLKQEVNGVLDLTDFMMQTFGYKYNAYLATRPEKSIGTDEEWEFATDALREALEERGLAYEVDEGGGVFYAPKIDIKLCDALGREWQGPTLPGRPEPAGALQHHLHRRGWQGAPRAHDPPHGAGLDGALHRRADRALRRRLPGLAGAGAGGRHPHRRPAQRVLPARWRRRCRAPGLRVKVDDSIERMQAKIREAQLQKVPYMLVVGDKEAAAEAVAVRSREDGDLGPGLWANSSIWPWRRWPSGSRPAPAAVHST